MELLLFSLPLVGWLMGLLQRADEGIGPYGNAGGFWSYAVYAATPARGARSDCAAAGGFAAYGCGVPLAGTARFSFGRT